MEREVGDGLPVGNVLGPGAVVTGSDPLAAAGAGARRRGGGFAEVDRVLGNGLEMPGAVTGRMCTASVTKGGTVGG